MKGEACSKKNDEKVAGSKGENGPNSCTTKMLVFNALGSELGPLHNGLALTGQYILYLT